MSVPNLHFIRQIDHWRAACQRLEELEILASSQAWSHVEHISGVAIRSRVLSSVEQLNRAADELWNMARSGINEHLIKQRLTVLRKQYMRTEMTIDYYGDAINTRTQPKLGSYLAALDHLASLAMSKAFLPLGYQVPPVLTYLDKGLGASILKAGLRLWDQKGVNPVAIIKIVRHNLHRPTALIHEVGHQMAYQLNWNKELAQVIYRSLEKFGEQTANIWSAWASEIAADAFAFICTGYGAVATLQDVLSGANSMVFHYHPGDPHPIPYLRVKLAVSMCRIAFGHGQWDDLEQHWLKQYPISEAPKTLAGWLAQQEEVVQIVAQTVLSHSFLAFHNRSLLQLININDLVPQQLTTWGNQFGAVNAWPMEVKRTHSIRLLALFVYRQATETYQSKHHRQEIKQWLNELGETRLYRQRSF